MKRPGGLALRGTVFYAVLVASFFASPYANLYFLLLVFLTTVIVVDAVSSWRNLRGVRVTVVPPEPFPSGTPALARVVADGGRRVRLGLEVVVALADRDRLRWPLPIVDGETACTGAIPARPRGRTDITAAWLVSTWPFGFVRVRRRIPIDGALVVYPAPVTDAVQAPGGGAGDDAAASAGRVGAVQPAGVREFRSGDSPRRVHWRATARRGVPVVSEWEAGRGTGREVVLDRRSDASTLEHNLGVVAALAHASRDDEAVLTLHTQGTSASFGDAQRPWRRLFETLAVAAPLPDDGAAPPPVSPGAVRLGAETRR